MASALADTSTGVKSFHRLFASSALANYFAVVLYDRLLSAVEDEELARWTTRVAEFVLTLTGSNPSELNGMAMMMILSKYRIDFRDGAVTNNPDGDINHEIWLTDAAVIMAAISDDPEKDWLYWKAGFPAFDKEDSTWEQATVRLKEKIRQSPEVVFFEG